jgi:TRAP-type C4-dicarboxylate transport system permease small subunit
MYYFINVVLRSSKFLNIVGGITLVLMMLLTVTDVVLRFFGKPITGTYELMGFFGALVIGFALAQTTLDEAHVAMDIVTQKLPPRNRDVLLVSTKVVSLALFALISWSLFLKGHDLYKAREVSLTLRVPYYPVAYGLSLCGLVECFVLLSDIIRIALGREGK